LSKKPKFYTVWRGAQPGVYDTWDECQQQIKGFKGGVYKAFSTRKEAEEALESSPWLYVGNAASTSEQGHTKSVQNPPDYRHDTVLPLHPDVEAEAIAVDGACSKNPGPMEYRGVYLRTGQEIFRFGPVYGTNNIGEFLAIVHALALLKQKGLSMTVYSDSRNALAWVKARKCRTTLERTPRTEPLYQLIQRAEAWLTANAVTVKLLKWQTSKWGECPADFGRK
jgi:ribonuclease HI